MAERKYDKGESFRDRVSTIDKEGKRSWIYAHKPEGRYYDMRSILTVVYVLILFIVPFIKVDGHPLFLFNIPERRFILFGFIFWPQDVLFFGLGMITTMVFVIVFTVAFGRLFCGWVCPQTIFMEMIFRRIEFWIEGDAPKQKALNKAPWNAEKIRKKGLKYLIFYGISFMVGNALLAYIIGVDDLFKIITEPVSQHVFGLTMMLLFSAFFFFLFSWFREQACTVVCPYGRLQGVLLDKDSYMVAYDYKRGEPRGVLRKSEERLLGDCIDCNLCVNVCPTGIDIRNGTQLECTNCTACIDACDNVMDKIQKPKGLIRYASENSIASGKPFAVTTRNKAYGVVLVALIGVLGVLLFTRTDIDSTIMRAKGMLYQEIGSDSISNLYTLKLVNKTYHDMPLNLKIEGIDAELRFIGQKGLTIKKEGFAETTFFVVLDKKKVQKRKTDIKIGLYHGNEKIKTLKTTFLGPVG
ncbi:MAG: cytochrome c oxidase accessory protein CcoG [Bacteroidia bacterium]|nr:cytochrome c oxidase accessory protein CcoG [Bacteroidia bacterium]